MKASFARSNRRLVSRCARSPASVSARPHDLRSAGLTSRLMCPRWSNVRIQSDTVVSGAANAVASSLSVQCGFMNNWL